MASNRRVCFPKPFLKEVGIKEERFIANPIMEVTCMLGNTCSYWMNLCSDSNRAKIQSTSTTFKQELDVFR